MEEWPKDEVAFLVAQRYIWLAPSFFVAQSYTEVGTELHRGILSSRCFYEIPECYFVNGCFVEGNFGLVVLACI